MMQSVRRLPCSFLRCKAICLVQNTHFVFCAVRLFQSGTGFSEKGGEVKKLRTAAAQVA